jgi:hypothetical protein
MEFEIKNKNCFQVEETENGFVITLKNKTSKVEKLKEGKEFWYVAFNALRGFFAWNGVWHDTEIDNALYEAGNTFNGELECKEVASGFNYRLKIRV